MIQKDRSYYVLQCDYCSNCVEDFLEFMDAVNYKKANKWKSENINGEWFDKCPDCLNKDNLFVDSDNPESIYYAGGDR